jgi:hypothetical protein
VFTIRPLHINRQYALVPDIVLVYVLGAINVGQWLADFRWHLDIKIAIFTGVQMPDLSACYQVILNTVGPLTDTAVCAISIPYTVTVT